MLLLDLVLSFVLGGDIEVVVVLVEEVEVIVCEDWEVVVNVYMKMVEMGVYDVEVCVGKLLYGFGFFVEMYYCVVFLFFGGWCVCLNLVCVLMMFSDLLLFDELINYFDLDVVYWLE